MRDLTLLDRCVAALSQTPQDEGRQRMFYDRLSGSDLYLLLETEATGDQINPRIMTSDGQNYVLTFDDPARLAEFAKAPAPFAAMPGKDLCALLALNGLGLALNPKVSAHPHLLPAADIQWIADNLGGAAQLIEAKLTGVRAPRDIPPTFLAAIEARLASFAGAARQAALVNASYDDGAERVFLGFIDADDARQPDLAAAIQDIVALIMPERAVDLGFFAQTDHITGALLRNGMVFDLPQAPTHTPKAPGMDPDNPPKL